MGLEEKRKKIDEVDGKMLELLNQRAVLAKEIYAEKEKQGSSAYAPEREKQVLESIMQKNKGPLSNESVDAIYQSIVSECRALEAKTKVAYLGPKTTFTHMAALKNFGKPCTFVAKPSIAEVFLEVEKGNAEYGVVPIENSTEGTVNHTLDVFMQSGLNIVAEVMLDVRHNLLSKHKLNEIKRIYSHSSALAQCRKWIAANLPKAELVDCSSTANAAEQAAQQPNSAAIASELAAREHGLNVLAENIQDLAHNITRFLVIGKILTKKSGKDKTSIMFSVKHEPGSLFRSLQSFAENNINMTKIESRPTREKIWEVVFFVDFEGYIEEKEIQAALDGMKENCLFVKILGSYPMEANVSE